MAKITIIVPVYGVEPYLKRCLNSVLDQSFSDYDVILIDDGSPDLCGSICNEYASRDKRIHVIRQKNGGLSAARNAGIEWSIANSDSEWLSFIDSDDWVHRDFLQLLYEAATSLNSDVACCEFIRTTGVEPKIAASKGPKLCMSEKFFCERHLAGIIICNKLIRKCLFATERFPVGRVHEDEYVTHHILFSKPEFALVDMPLYNYFYRSDSISGKAFDIRYLDKIPAYEEQIAFFKTHGYIRARKFITRVLLSFMAEAILHLREMPENGSLALEIDKKFRYLVREAMSEIELPIISNYKIFRVFSPVRARIVYPLVAMRNYISRLLKR